MVIVMKNNFWRKVIILTSLSMLFWVVFFNINNIKIQDKYCSYIITSETNNELDYCFYNLNQKKINEILNTHQELLLNFNIISTTNLINTSFCLENSSCFLNEYLNDAKLITDLKNLNNSLVNEFSQRKDDLLFYNKNLNGLNKNEKIFYDDFIKKNNISQKETIYCLFFKDCDG